ncbi:NDR1/HIN1-like protein 6 [Glycine soja]|uniref:NDR1/HIN1-like protein 6 n=1 Tax=Glycine soja TaxID=3848 RepID=A0A0B2QSS3_GLYSO|nr:NDR1/HIN1-like protein 6 [Glycine soja]KHN24686.1 Putative syntaxin-24 [Glycine soja]RZB81074.1 NDR1/HIN1-like protein 6 [Glycine soja]
MMAAEHQRIHPVHDVEAQHRPLVPQNIAKSDDKGIPHRTFPVMHSKPPKRRRSCCCRFMCWTLSILLILIIAIAITIGILYLVFRPKLPKYSVDQLRISQFNVSDNNTLYATFNVAITARNPNKKIGIYYEGGSHISAWYMETQLCEGSLPKFYQGHRNTTVLDLPLTGQAHDANGLVNRIQEQLQQTNNVPLNLKVNQPVRVKLGKLKLFKVKFRVRCKLEVDNILGASNDIRISRSSCKFKLRL